MRSVHIVKAEDIICLLEHLKIPSIVIAIVLGLVIVLQVILWILEINGKIVLECVNIKRHVKKKKQKKQEQVELLQEVKTLLNDVNSHYSADNIAQRDSWMDWVNQRADVYDAALKELVLLKDKLDENNEITLDLYINANRNRILDFSRIVVDNDALVSKEEFNRIYKINNEYHSILNKYKRENGEVDTAMRIINEAYEYRLKHHCFIEDIRGYNTK